MIFASALSHELNIILGIATSVLLIGLVLKRLKQPYIIAYILTGVLLGPSGVHLITDFETAELIGEFGLVILMFFIGMEISLSDFIRKWRVALFGTGMQVLFSILIVYILGAFLDWPFKRVLLLGFIISLSSSAVVIRLVEDHGLLHKRIGQQVISILLTQDILIVPMIILMSFVGDGALHWDQISLQLIGGLLIVLFLFFLLRKKEIRIPFAKDLEDDHELQVFAGLIICFAFALFTSSFELSAGLGAFVAGLFINASPANHWLHERLHSFRVLLISVFFLSVGMQINLDFLATNWLVVTLMVLVVYISNHGINTFALRGLGNSWHRSIYGASLLAQIGEFSYVLASLGYHSEIITNYTYQLTVLVISITIFISPLWVDGTKLLIGRRQV
jgi:CPA2 family monovalent cation:H+ antiporter-2